ncbi:MAG: T9SS type A sorting domain-containing protein [Sphingobacteriales bacterium]|nr:MAG: T9SS type A sorting domain-containing protein [Sphingobacteriales bacterium]
MGTISGPTGVCANVAPTGVAAVYTVFSSDALSVFNWTLPLGALNVTGQGTGTISFKYPSGFIAGTISVDVSSTCGAVQNRTLNVGATTPSMPGIVTGITNVCPYIGLPDQLTYSIDPVPGALSYEWTIPSSCSFVSGQGTNSIAITVGSNFQSIANKVIKVRVMSGCGNSGYQLKYLNAQFPMTPGPITGSNDICEVINTPTEVTYYINKVLAATSYVWTLPPGATATHPGGPGINDTLIKVVFDNTFVTSHISVISVNNCLTSGSSRSLLVYRKNPPTPGPITGPTNACEYSLPSAVQAYYTFRKVPVATSYTWTVPPGATITHENAPGVNDTAIFVTFPNGYSSGNITVKSHNGCGTSGIRSLSVVRLNTGMPSAIDIATASNCPVRQFVYSISTMPYNATSVVWTVPPGGNIDFGQGTSSIQVTYTGAAIAGDVTVQAFNNCSQSLIQYAHIKLPACPPEPKIPVTPEFVKVEKLEEIDLALYPNPSASNFKVVLKSADKAVAKLRVMDVLGKVLYEYVIQPGEMKQLGEKLKAGSYFIEVQQGDKRKTLRAIKL